ncbi:MAG: Cna B-type domain-containing protein [Oscillospiraceae bacterium]
MAEDHYYGYADRTNTFREKLVGVDNGDREAEYLFESVYGCRYYVEDNGTKYVAYCFNWRKGFQNTYFLKHENADAATLNNFAYLQYSSEEEMATRYENILKAVYNGYPQNGGYGVTDNGIYASSGLSSMSDGEYYFRLATQCAVWTFADGATFDQIVSASKPFSTWKGYADLYEYYHQYESYGYRYQYYANMYKPYYDRLAAIEDAYNKLTDSSNLTRPTDYTLNLYTRENPLASDYSSSSTQNLLATKYTGQTFTDTTLNIGVTKVWYDGGNTSGIRPDVSNYFSTYVHLYRKPQYVTDSSGNLVENTGDPEEVTVDWSSVSVIDNGDNTYSATITGLARTDSNGIAYIYTMSEDQVPGYVSVPTSGEASGDYESGFALINAQYTSMHIEETWDGPVGADEITVRVYAESDNPDEERTLYLTTTISAEDNWELDIDKLPMYEPGGYAVTYSVEEDSVDGYSTSITTDDSNVSIVNTSTATTDISVEKIWEGKEGEKATITLYADGTEVGTVDLTSSNNWSYTWSGLTKYNSDGSEIEYTISETDQPGYTCSISGSAEEGFTVTNTYTDIPKTGDNSSVTMYLMFGAAAAAGAVYIISRRKKSEK